MPLRVFVCSSGHQTERLERRRALPSRVLCECGEQAKRVEVSRTAHPQRMDGWGSDFEWDPTIRDIHEQAQGHKAEALAAKTEAEANGFRLCSLQWSPGRKRIGQEQHGNRDDSSELR